MQRMAHVDGEIASARAAAAKGTLFCLSSLSTTNLVDVAKKVPDGLKWFQLYICQSLGKARHVASTPLLPATHLTRWLFLLVRPSPCQTRIAE